MKSFLAVLLIMTASCASVKKESPVAPPKVEADNSQEFNLEKETPKTEPITQTPPVATPPSNAWEGVPAQDQCLTMVRALCQRVEECGVASLKDCVYHVGPNCLGVTAVESERLYAQCIPAIKGMACDAELPDQCVEIFR